MGRRHRSHGNHRSHGSHSNHGSHGNHSNTAPTHGNHGSHANSTNNTSLRNAITPPAGAITVPWGAALPETASQADVEARLKQIRDNIATIRSSKSTEATLSAGSAVVRNPSIADLPNSTFNSNEDIAASQPNTVAQNLNTLSRWMRSSTTGHSNTTATSNPSNDGTQPAPTTSAQSHLRKSLIEGIQAEVQSLAAQNLSGRHRSHWNSTGAVPTGHASHSNHSNHQSHGNARHNSHRSHSSSSDERLKTNIETISYGLQEVLKLNAVHFDWKDSQDTSFGFIAQEVEKVLPEAVATDDQGYLTVNYGILTAVLTKAIQELATQPA